MGTSEMNITLVHPHLFHAQETYQKLKHSESVTNQRGRELSLIKIDRPT
jgi:hypothetical protein